MTLNAAGLQRGGHGDLGRPSPTRSLNGVDPQRLLHTAVAAPAGSTAARFTDVPDDHPNARAMNALKTIKVINGVSETHYAPEGPVTRGAIASLIVRATTTASQRPSIARTAAATLPPPTRRTSAGWSAAKAPGASPTATTTATPTCSAATVTQLVRPPCARHLGYHASAQVRVPRLQHVGHPEEPGLTAALERARSYERRPARSTTRVIAEGRLPVSLPYGAHGLTCTSQLSVSVPCGLAVWSDGGAVRVPM